MDLYTSPAFDIQTDLDDEKAYTKNKIAKKYYSGTTHELWDKCIQEIGYVHMYFNYFHPDTDWGSQKSRFEAFCFWFAREERQHRFDDTPENRLWFKKWLYRFHNAFENLC